MKEKVCKNCAFRVAKQCKLSPEAVDTWVPRKRPACDSFKPKK